MKLSREWITPVTIGSFVPVAITGVLMFFHLDTGWNKQAHEWLSWIFLAAVALHIVINIKAFKKPFLSAKGRTLLAVFALLLVATFVPVRPGGGEPPFAAPIRALGQAPLSQVALIAHIDKQELERRLHDADLEMKSDAQSIEDLVGKDLRKQVKVLNQILAE